MVPDLNALQAHPSELFGIIIIDPVTFLELIIRFIFNFAVIMIIVRGLYYPVSRQKDYLFSFILIGVVVFLICFLLQSEALELAFALGLFAIFAIIRYRTNPIPIKEMTYLFITIGLSVINALASQKVSYLGLVFTNISVVIIVYLLEKVWLVKNEARKIINYEKIELIKPEKRAELIADLKKRTGLNIHRVEIGRINFLRDTVRIRVYYMEESTSSEDGIISGSYNDE